MEKDVVKDLFKSLNDQFDIEELESNHIGRFLIKLKTALKYNAN